MDDRHKLAFHRFFGAECPACGSANWSDANWYCASIEDGGCGFSVSKEVCDRAVDGIGSPEVTRIRAAVIEEALSWSGREGLCKYDMMHATQKHTFQLGRCVAWRRE